MAKRTAVAAVATRATPKYDGVELMAEHNAKGIEVELPGTERLVRLRALDAEALLKEGKMPDLLTPLVIKSVYAEMNDREVREFLGQQRNSMPEALAHLETVNYVVEKGIADGTKVKDLTLAEKRWIFRLVMEPAELLITFRYDKDASVELVAESEELRETP